MIHVGLRYSSALCPSGPEFQVNTYTTLYQGEPAVTTDANGDFVVVWQSDEQDGDLTGIYAQRYDAADSNERGITNR
jgi:hypothetical protein